MLLIDDDQPKIGHRAEDGTRAGTDHDRGFAGAYPMPLVEPLAIAQPVVEDGDLSLKRLRKRSIVWP